MKPLFRSTAMLLGLTALVSTGFSQSFSGRYALIKSAQAQTTAPVGTMAGSFQVNGNGGADYTIPIEVPPGRSGIQPKLSLHYNSQQTNGLLGMGWSLTGLSAIARCPKTIAQDGVVGGVSYNSSDRFCLDGQRLVAVSGIYGVNGTEYSTERESWMKIVSHGSAGSGPEYFTAVAKDGSEIEFGHTADSRIEATGKSEVRVWSVNKVTNRNGNYLTVAYTDDSANGAYYPATIQYTGHIGYTPKRRVDFVFEGRTDSSTAYLAGSVVKSTKRLQAVQTYVGTTLVKQYNLAYEYGPATGRSRMTSVQECGGDGVCLLATTFGWNPNPSFGQVNALPHANGRIEGDWCGDAQVFSWSDFNGDGLEDLHCSLNSDHSVWISDGTGNLTPPPNSTSSSGLIKEEWCGNDPASASWSDFNGDGLEDLHCDKDEQHHVLISDGTGNLTAPPNSISTSGLIKSDWCGDAQVFSWSDFDGDGLQDLHCDGLEQHHVLISDGTGKLTAPPNSISTSGLIKADWCGDAQVSSWSDFDGDGLQDLHCDGLNKHHVLISDGTGNLTPPNSSSSLIKAGWCNDPTASSSWSDFNGDGLEDLHCDKTPHSPGGLVVVEYEESYHQVLISDGTGNLTAPPNSTSTSGLIKSDWCGNNATNHTVTFWSDFNGDGLEDLHCNEGMNHYVLISDGTGNLTSPNSDPNGLIHPIWCPPSFFTLSDFNGDGLADLHCDNSGGYHGVLHNSAVIPDRIITITNGLGSQTLVEYKPLTDGSVYTKGSGAVFPVVDVQVPMYVVSRHTTKESASSSTSFIYDHQYETARANLHRGWQGFATTILIDQQNDTKTTTKHYMDFPP